MIKTTGKVFEVTLIQHGKSVPLDNVFKRVNQRHPHRFKSGMLIEHDGL